MRTWRSLSWINIVKDHYGVRDGGASRARRLARWLLIGARQLWLMLGILLVTVFLCEAGLRGIFDAKDRWIDAPPTPSVDARAGADGYHGAAFTSDYFTEFRKVWDMDWHSYVYWRRAMFRGRYINIDAQGLRYTWRADLPGGDQPGEAIRVFVFGGSAVWGTGARDHMTIPSCVARMLASSGFRAEVVNFGESGYVSTQEVIGLLRCLQRGDIPDLVVFYDGVNDVYSAKQNREAGIPQNEVNRRTEFNLLKAPRRLLEAYRKTRPDRLPGFRRLATSLRRRLVSEPGAEITLAGPGPAEESLDMDKLEEDLIRVYQANVRAVQALSEAYGFDALYYLQPVIFTKRHLSAYEAQVIERKAYIKDFYLKAYRRLGQSSWLRQHGQFHNLSGLFDDNETPYYIDFCHLTEGGNMIVAKEIVSDVVRLFEKRRYPRSGR